MAGGPLRPAGVLLLLVRFPWAPVWQKLEPPRGVCAQPSPTHAPACAASHPRLLAPLSFHTGSWGPSQRPGPWEREGKCCPSGIPGSPRHSCPSSSLMAPSARVSVATRARCLAGTGRKVLKDWGGSRRTRAQRARPRSQVASLVPCHLRLLHAAGTALPGGLARLLGLCRAGGSLGGSEGRWQ